MPLTREPQPFARVASVDKVRQRRTIWRRNQVFDYGPKLFAKVVNSSFDAFFTHDFAPDGDYANTYARGQRLLSTIIATARHFHHQPRTHLDGSFRAIVVRNHDDAGNFGLVPQKF